MADGSPATGCPLLAQCHCAAIAGNLFVAAIRFGASALTGSSAMLSEAVHSVVDTGNSLLLLHGLRRSKEPPDHDHPLGYGLEI